MKWYVIATHWDDEKKAQAKYIAGEFPKAHLAYIFKKAYEEEFSAHPFIVSENELLKALEK